MTRESDRVQRRHARAATGIFDGPEPKHSARIEALKADQRVALGRREITNLFTNRVEDGLRIRSDFITDAREDAMFRKSRNLERLCGCMDRRDLMCGAALTALLATIGSGVRPARAAGASRTRPEIDRLAVRVLVDSYQFAVAPGRRSGSVEIVNFGWGIDPFKTARQDARQRIRARHARAVEARR